MFQKTLVVLKPDAVERELVQQILAFLEAEKFSIITQKKVHATEENLDKHFPNDVEWVRALGERACKRITEERGEDPKERFGTSDTLAVGRILMEECRKYYRLGPLVVVVLAGEEAISRVRGLLGSALPSKAIKDAKDGKKTIRGLWGIPEDPNSIAATRNLVHASDSETEVEREIAAWFTKEEVIKIDEDVRSLNTSVILARQFNTLGVVLFIWILAVSAGIWSIAYLLQGFKLF